MTSTKKIARTAGFLYLLNIVFSVFYMEYIPSEIFVNGNSEETWNNLLSNESLFRFGITIAILVHLSFILLPLTLYRLLNHIHKNVATLMVILALISVPISYVLILDQITILDYINGYSELNSLELANVQLEVTSFYKNLMNNFFINQTFWGLWLFPFGWLAYKSTFLPKVLGVFLMLGCITYMIDVFGAINVPNYYNYVNTSILIIPAAIGEIGSCIWLLTIGVKENIKF